MENPLNAEENAAKRFRIMILFWWISTESNREDTHKAKIISIAGKVREAAKNYFINGSAIKGGGG